MILKTIHHLDLTNMKTPLEILNKHIDFSKDDLITREQAIKAMEEYKDQDAPISAFAYKTAREIEEIINKRTNRLHDTNQLLEARILEFYRKIQADNNNSIAGKWVDIYKETFDLDVSPF